MANRRLEGRWDCSNCSTTQIKGRHKSCPNCGDARNPHTDPSEKPYLLTNEQAVTEPELLDMATAGPDKQCGHCGSAIRGDATSCRSCGHPIDETDIFGQESEDVEYRSPAAHSVAGFTEKGFGPITEVLAPKRIEPVQVDEATYSDPARRQKFLLAGGVSVIAVISLSWLMYAFFFQTERVTLQVTSLDWIRQVEIEEYRTLTETDWSVPSGGRQLRAFEDVHHYDRRYSHDEQRSRQVSEQVFAGNETVHQTCTRDSGNGFFEQYDCSYTVPRYETQYRTEYYTEPVYVSVPVYRTKYQYEIERWVTDRWEKAPRSTDPGNRRPYWPEPELLPEGFRVGDSRKQSYTVTLSDGAKKQFLQKPDFNIWNKLELGQEIQVELNRQGKLRGVDWPET